MSTSSRNPLIASLSRRLLSLLLVALLVATGALAGMISSLAAVAGYQWPLKGSIRVTSSMGPRTAPTVGASTSHKGTDLAAAVGTPVYPTKAGKVAMSKNEGATKGYGSYLVVDHGGGVFSLYAHLSKKSVVEGQQVTQSTKLGESGQTGNVTGPHLHFEIRTNTTKSTYFSSYTLANPEYYCSANTSSSVTRPNPPTLKLETPAVQQQGNAMKLSWNKISGADYYRVNVNKQDYDIKTGKFQAERTVTNLNGDKNSLTYSHATTGNLPGIYTFYVYSHNSAGFSTNRSNTVTIRVNPAYPTPAPGFEDLTSSFANGSYGKTIYLTNVISNCLVQNSSPSGAGNVIGSGNNKGSYERWKVVQSGNNVALQSVASGKYLVVGSATSAASASSAGAGSQFHIYRNTSNGYYYLRMSSGNYVAVDNGTKALRYTTTQPDATAGNLTWERFKIEAETKAVYGASADIADGWYTIQGVGSGMYISQSASYAKTKGLYSNYPSTENGQLYICGTPSTGGYYADQYWYFQRQSDGTYRIHNYANTSLYMDVRGAWLWNGAEAIAYTNSAQRWYVISTENGQYKLVNQQTGGVLDVKGNGTAHATGLQQYVDNGTTAQRFKLTRVDFSITYDANGGIGVPASVAVTTTPMRLTTLDLPTRPGYIFTGWSTQKSDINKGTVQYVPGNTYTFNAGMTLYAVWCTASAPSTYTVNYDFATNGGTSATADSASGLGTGATVDLTPTAEKDGYVFVGWNTNKDATTKLTNLTVASSNITLFAIFSKTVPTTFTDAAGVQVVNVPFYNNQTEVTIPSAPVQRNYAGWNGVGWIAGPELDLANIALPVEIVDEYEEPVDPGDPVVPANPGVEPADLDDALTDAPESGDEEPGIEPQPDGFLVSLDGHSFYGLYERELTLSYDSDGGTPVAPVSVTQQVNSADLSAVESVECVVADYIEKEDEIFKYWATPSGEPVSPEQTITIEESLTLKAVWLDKYTIAYSAPGAEEIPEQHIKYEDMPIELSTEIPYKEGFTFLGWAISNGGNVVYEPFEEYLYEDDASLTLHAIWRQDADNTVLNDALLEALDLGEENDGKYTEASWTALQTAMNNAFNANELIYALDDTYSTQTDIDNATAAVRAAIDGLTLAPVYFSVTVNSGTGGGNFAQGVTVTIAANAAPSGKVFDKWTASDGVTFANASNTSTTFTMPAKNATVTATYKDAAKKIFSTKYDSNFLNWILFIVCFGWIWMWFVK